MSDFSLQTHFRWLFHDSHQSINEAEASLNCAVDGAPNLKYLCKFNANCCCAISTAGTCISCPSASDICIRLVRTRLSNSRSALFSGTFLFHARQFPTGPSRITTHLLIQRHWQCNILMSMLPIPLWWLPTLHWQCSLCQFFCTNHKWTHQTAGDSHCMQANEQHLHGHFVRRLEPHSPHAIPLFWQYWWSKRRNICGWVCGTAAESDDGDSVRAGLSARLLQAGAPARSSSCTGNLYILFSAFLEQHDPTLSSMSRVIFIIFQFFRITLSLLNLPARHLFALQYWTPGRSLLLVSSQAEETKKSRCLIKKV